MTTRTETKKKIIKSLEEVPWRVTNMFDDIEDTVHAFELLFKDVVKEHIKTRLPK